MTQLLEKAFSEAAKLPVLQQNILAKWILDEILTENKWDSLFAGSEDALSDMADEALSEYKQGKTTVID